jgi:DNA-binding CsgD family transcriptional regulator
VLNLGCSSAESGCGIRGTVAASLLAEVAAAPGERLLTGVSGVAGSGKSALLDDLADQYRSLGVSVRRELVGVERDRVAPDSGAAERTAVLVDDAHELPDQALARIRGLVGRPELNLVVAYGLWPTPPMLKRLASELSRHHLPVVLGPLLRADIAAHITATAGIAPNPFVDKVAELTGGVPWLVHAVMRATREDGRRVVLDSGLLRGIKEQLGLELTGVDEELHELLLALAVGFDLAGRLPPHLDGVDLDGLIARARAGGFVLSDGRIVPLVRGALLQTTPAYRVHSLQRALVDVCIADGRPLDEVARVLALGGLKDARIASALEHAADRVLPTQPTLASTLYDEATAAGADELATAARRAQAASSIGDLDGAARIVDDLLHHDDAPDRARGVDVAAAVWAQRGMLARSAEIYRWLGVDQVGESAALAAVAMIGTGDRAGADRMLAGTAPAGSVSVLTVASTLMGQGLLHSIDENAHDALPALVRASDMMTASGATAAMPEFPAALAALVALNTGDLSIADSVLDAAIERGQCGPTARARFLLLKAWAAMMADRTDRAAQDIRRATESQQQLTPRDELWLRALEVGLARRADDVPGMVWAWKRARESVLHVAVDLYSLLPLGELLIVGSRLGEVHRIGSALAEAWSLLDRLSDPPLWSLPLHWSAIQSAILVERPADLAPHAASLAHAKAHSPMAAVLASAGKEWVSVLAGTVDVSAVETAARALASVGFTWDGSRLAGHAAARADDRKDMARLLACARDLHPRTPADEPPPHSAPGSPQVRDASMLSAREREVARLVLEGKTYWEIGEAMFISPRTVEHHIARMRQRLGASSRGELLGQLRIALGPDGDDPHGP